jgi:Ser/Thr protein kinase RdoA (MazF antagonist)
MDETGEQVEVPLAGGVANAGGVVRVGDHVLRPSNAHTPSIHRYLRHLAGAGFDGASRPLGVDPDGRERLDFIPGDVALPPYPAWAQSDAALASMTALLARMHSASAGFDLAGTTWCPDLADPIGGPTVCHNDVCLENVIFENEVAVGLIDFDLAAPGRPVHDVAALARMCVPIDDEINASRLGWEPADRPARLRLVADVYGLDAGGRVLLFELLSATMATVGRFVRRRVEAGDPNFIAMWNESGGAERYARRARWWIDRQHDFRTALQ